MKKIIKLTIILILLFVVWFNFELFFKQKNSCEQQLFFEVPRGQGFIEIGNNLKKQEIIRSSFVFQVYALISGKYTSLQAGAYLISPCNSVIEIVKSMSSGNIAQNRITIIEGWNIQQIGQHLQEKEIVSKQEFIEIVENGNFFKQEFDFLKDKPNENSLEGYLFPDTYSFPINSSTEDIIRIMLTNFDNKLTPQLRQEIINKDKSIFEIIIIASLIEKEVRTYQDKELVSGIIYKRMSIGMPLQIDATIAYITGRRTTRISISETQIDSLYNTYKYRGLPVGPISNPGIDSIKAAIFPKESDYLFYLSKPDGETVFSRNLQEHNIAKNKYLR